uniref:EB domain-containing protein n=1 Tax=Heterorhabditis bacteriophora TaxID=37862 RepID=A0A1I7XW52_HETBA
MFYLCFFTLFIARPGLSCRNNEVCIGGSICTLPMGLCLCPGDLEERDGECVLPVSSSIKITKVGIGALCSDLAECEHGSTCVKGRCDCLSPLVQLDGKCILKQDRKEVDSPIDMTYSWIPEPASSLSTTEKPPTTQSLLQSMATELSTETNHASSIRTIFTASPTKSVFKTNHIKNTLGGSKQGGVGVHCSLNTDCMIGAYCNGNTNPPSCQCLSTHVNIEKRCQKVVYPGQIGCRSDLQCSAAYTGTTCIDRICVCSEGLKAVDQTCVPEFADPNEKCGFLPTKHIQPECQGGSVCRNGLCVCPTPLILSPNKTCIPSNPSSIDGSLIECDPACDFPRVCINNRCDCLDVVLCSSIQLHRSRRQSVEKSMICWPGAEKCSDGNGICIEGVCHCTNGLILVDGLCRPEFIPLWGSCNLNINSPRCEDNAACVNGVCTCKLFGGCANNNVIFSSKTRYQDERCFSDTQCQPGAHCIEERCQCYEETMKNGICSSSIGAFKNINSPCSGSDRCSSGSVCRDHVCQCVGGSRELHGRCHQVSGGRCSHGQTCDGGSVCEFGVCRCPESHIINAGQCLLALSEPGQSCQLGQKCIHGSVCRFGLCMCIAKFLAIKGRCVKRESLVIVRPKNAGNVVNPGNIRTPGTQCMKKDICSGGSRCQEGFCICNDLEVIINNQCVGSHNRANEVINELLIAAPGQPCEARTNCTGGSTCIDRICKCENGKIDDTGICLDSQKYEYSFSETAAKIKPDMVPGSTCTLTLQCPYRTECIKGVCRCKRGETIVNNTCRSAIHGVLPGGKCDPRKGYDCIAESQCYYGVCSCLRHLVNNGKECVTPAEIEMISPGNPCASGQICSGGARCIEQICRCNIDEVLDVNKKCVKKTSVYPLFNTSPEVSRYNVSLESSVVGNTTSSHLPRLGEQCNMDCSEGECVNNRCISPHDENIKFQGQINIIEELEMELKNNPIHSFSDTNVNPTIVESTIFGHQCHKKEDCPTNSFCFERLCRCMNGFRATGGYCEPIIKVGEVCISTNQCEGNAFCIEGRCSCQTLNGRTCSEPFLSHPGEDCTQQQICSYNSYCGLLSGVCECPRGMATINGRCELTSVTSGTACITSKNCHNFSYCDNGFCLCKTGFIFVNNFCLPPGASINNEDNSREEEFDDKFMKQSNKKDEIDQKSIINEPITYSNFPILNNLVAAQSTNFETQQTDNSASPLTEPDRNSNLDFNKPPINYPVNSNIGTVMPDTHFPVSTSIIETPPPLYHFIPSFPPNPYLQIGKFSIPFAKGANTKLGEGLISNTEKHTKQNLKMVMPGEYCGDGSVCLGNSICNAEFCRCPNKSHVKNGICTTINILDLTKIRKNDIEKLEQEDETKEERQFAAPLENCQNFEFCTGGSECLNIRGIGLVCQCPYNKIFLDNECVDVPKKALLVGIGDKCDGGEICLGGSTCSHDICICEDGKKDILGICVITAKAGDSCAGGEICIDGSLCTSSMRTCVCPPGKLSRLGQCIDGDTSLEYRYSSNPGEFCNSHAICTDNSFCNGRGICQCLPKFENLKGRCLPTNMISHPGAECFPSTICSGGSECQKGFCVCPKGKLLLNNYCVYITNQVRHKQAQIFECHKDTDCPVHYRCAGGICVCHGISSECLTMMHMDSYSQCIFNHQCPKNANCVGNVCICNDGFKMVDSMCVQRRMATVPSLNPADFNISMTESGESYMPSFKTSMKSTDDMTTEEDSVSTAKDYTNHLKVSKGQFDADYINSTLNKNIIYLEESSNVDNKPKPGTPCSKEGTCANGSICFEGYCVCGFEDVVRNDRCVPRDNNIGVGDRCSDVYRCRIGLLCVDGKCSCDINDLTCNANETVTSPPGGSCSDARECIGGSACHEGWCICPDPTMIVQKGICIQPGPRPTVPPKMRQVVLFYIFDREEPHQIDKLEKQGGLLLSMTEESKTRWNRALFDEEFIIFDLLRLATMLANQEAACPTQLQENYSGIKQFNTLSTVQGRKAVPGTYCGPLDICVGNSMCVDGLCVCPVDYQPSKSGHCEKALSSPATITASGSVHMGKFTHHRTHKPGSSSALLPTPDYIELPTHAPLTTANTHLESDECVALGLFCRGNTVCRNRSCQCPEEYVLHNDACVLPHDMERRKKPMSLMSGHLDDI